MILPHHCPECGETGDIGINTTVLVNQEGEPITLKLDYTCLVCSHNWTIMTADFCVDVDKRSPDER